MNDENKIHPDTDKPKAVKVTVTVPQKDPEDDWADYNVDIIFSDSVTSAQLNQVALKFGAVQIPISLSQLLLDEAIGNYGVFLVAATAVQSFSFPPSSPSSTVEVLIDGSSDGNENVAYAFPDFN